jgi:energy-coupling factor transport system ATP-binding protein
MNEECFTFPTRLTGGLCMARNLIEFKDVSFRYSEQDPWVLKNVSFTINEDEWVAIIGHNGSGKSTIAKLINGLLFPEKGEILIGGKKVTEDSIWEIRKDVGMVFQNPDNQFVGATVQDDVAFGMENRGIPRQVMLERIQSTLEAVGMLDYQLTEPHRLSGGQKQRIAIAGVLAISPRVLILDEATAMLDPHGRKEIMQTVSQLQSKQGLALITITHDLQEVVQADRVIVMNKGVVWEETVPREIFTKKEELRKIGLDVPFVTILADSLKDIGVNVSKEPLNHEELLEDLWTLHLRT